MKVIILAGGLPSTLIEEDEKLPKPMVEIGNRPILWHIMKYYSYYGFNEFIVCTGYKGEMIKDYFMNFYIYQSDITVDLQSNHIEIHRKQTEDWEVSVIDTGLHSTIAERIKMAQTYLNHEPFIVVYGDCVADINIPEMVKMHQEGNRIATIAVTHPTGRNETLPINSEGRFFTQKEKSDEHCAWVNACNMVFEPEIITYLEQNPNLLNADMLNKMIKNDQIQPYQHKGFWLPMETIRDKKLLETYWKNGTAPWRVWQ